MRKEQHMAVGRAPHILRINLSKKQNITVDSCQARVLNPIHHVITFPLL